MTSPKKRRPFWLVGLLAVGALFVASALGLLVARFTIFVPYRQPSGSMYPTLKVGVMLFANGLDRTPVRGAVMVFRSPERREQLFDKRVIGLPGDVVRTKGKTVLVNDWEIPRCIVGRHTFAEPTGEQHAGELAVEHLGDLAYLVFDDDDGALTTDEAGGPWRVSDGQYFVLGDNRANSHDSRMWFGGVGGGVPFDETVGRVRGLERPELPPGAEPLRAAFDACLAKRPAQTTPPAPR